MYLRFCNNSRSISSISDKYASLLTSDIIVQLHKGQSGYKWHILNGMWWEASYVKAPWGIFLNTEKSPLGSKSFPTILSLKRGETDWFCLSPGGWKPPNRSTSNLLKIVSTAVAQGKKRGAADSGLNCEFFHMPGQDFFEMRDCVNLRK